MSSSIDAAHDRVTRRVIGKKGVAGTAIGTRGGRPCLKVYLEKDDRALRQEVAAQGGGGSRWTSRSPGR